ncbi:nucleocapsid protein [Wufeng Rhinolophus sinicus rubulavirus 1]|uniref:Nucleocapsid n=1 Tax=Wufeng Rhinolophus sinicus rubulavirus 1 TaxID=2877512 RepID=A0AAE9BU78_9MONO|nr:nucleocapsid protein [Wufeng Rhinolophus sinicus rubulavirus 1]
MSSVLQAYEHFLVTSEERSFGDQQFVQSDTLKAEIPVFVLNTNDPQQRYTLMNFCLRLAVSSSAKSAIRQGAILSLMSLQASSMLNHLTIAARAPDASLRLIEIDKIDPKDYTLTPNARSGWDDKKVRAYKALVRDLPASLADRTVFTNRDAEMAACDDMDTYLARIFSILIQIWVMVCKCMTAYDQPTGSEERRLAKYKQQGRMLEKYQLQPEARKIIQITIRESMVIRQFLVQEMLTADKVGAHTNRYYAMVGDIAKYIANVGMSAFFLTLKFALGNRWKPLALSAFSGELMKMKSLMSLYRRLGDRARYLALLESPELMEFAPANYPLLFSYAMGVGSIQDPLIRNYQFGRNFLNTSYFQYGVETAMKHQGTVDPKLAEELGITSDDKKEIMASVEKHIAGKSSDEITQPAGPFLAPTSTTAFLTGPGQTDQATTRASNYSQGWSSTDTRDMDSDPRQLAAPNNDSADEDESSTDDDDDDTPDLEDSNPNYHRTQFPPKPPTMPQKVYDDILSLYYNEVEAGSISSGDMRDVNRRINAYQDEKLMADFDK